MYTLADFARIEKTCKFVIPFDVKQTIQLMCKSVGVQPVFTVLAQSKNTMQDAIREINKLTEANRLTQIPLILEIVSHLDHSSFADVFFQMVGKNPFCSKTYVTLFHQLQLQWSIFTELFEVKYRDYIDSFGSIVTVDQENYDLFCECKASNDVRRTFTLFIMHATTTGILHTSLYDRVLDTILARIVELMDHPGKEEMNELVENLFLLKPRNPDVVKQITEWTKLKPSDHAGLNYKILFRFMDIIQ
jgi:hypothetical protein